MWGMRATWALFHGMGCAAARLWDEVLAFQPQSDLLKMYIYK